MVVDRKMDNLNGAVVVVVLVNKKASRKGLVVVDLWCWYR